MLGFNKVQYDVEKSTNDRIADRAAGKAKNKKDVLNGLLDVVETKGPELNFKASDVAVELWTTICAGSDTTAFTLISLVYMLMKNPDKFDILLDELESAFSSGALPEPVRYNDAIKLSYLRACVTEAMRIHPAIGSMLPRYVPKEGAMIAGKWFPGGTLVGVNQLVVHHDKGLFGQDAYEYVPERWLKCSEKEAAYMERHLLTFGYGTRVCIGRQITMTEMYKLLLTIFRKYDFELMAKEWTVEAGWFAVPSNVQMKVTQRRQDLRRAV